MKTLQYTVEDNGYYDLITHFWQYAVITSAF